MVDTWEAFQDYKRTAIVLDHFDHEINTVLGGAHTEDGEHCDVKVMLLAGSDLIGTMSEPGVWSYADVGRSPQTTPFHVDRPRWHSWITS
jgi:nicotinamide mononucleotide adenylyltransferase